MARGASDQSHLFTGKNAPSTTKTAKQKSKERNERLAKEADERRAIQPEAELVFALLEVEIKKLMFGVYPEEEKMTDRQFAIERHARRLTVATLKEFKSKLSNIMRVAPDRDKPKEKAKDWTEEVDSEINRS